MNQAFLRPPLPLFRWLGLLAAPLVMWGVLHAWCWFWSPLESLYWWPYVRSQAPLLYSVNQPGPAHPITKAEYRLGMPGHFTAYQRPAATHAWLRENVYDSRSAIEMIGGPLWLGGLLGFALVCGGYWFDLHRHFQFRSSGRQLRGPEYLTPREFEKKVKGDGIGIRLERITPWAPAIIRVERRMESQHFQFIGDQGSGKTSAMFSVTDEAEELDETCVIYDPHREFIKRYWNPKRGDQILGLDGRGAGWNPSEEIDWSSESTAEATTRAQAASLYPGHAGQRDWFFTSVARDVNQYCMIHYRPNAAQLADLYSHADPLIDHIVKGTQLEETLMKNSSGTRPSIMGTLTTNIVGMLRQIQTPSAEHPGWSAREYVKHRRGWLFLTSTQETREESGPLQRLWIDSLIRGMLSAGPQPNLPKVRVALDELWSLGELGQLKSGMAEARKAGFTFLLGFHGRAQVRALYGDEAESIFSAPFLKLLLRTGEPESAEWVSRLIGKREMERVREHRAPKGQRSYTTEQREEAVVYPSELMGLTDRRGYLRYGNYVVPVKVAIAPSRPDRTIGYIPRAGNPPEILPMPNLEELRAKDAAEKAQAAAKAANFIYDPAKATGAGPGPASGMMGLLIPSRPPRRTRGKPSGTGQMGMLDGG